MLLYFGSEVIMPTPLTFVCASAHRGGLDRAGLVLRAYRSGVAVEDRRLDALRDTLAGEADLLVQ